MDEDLDGYSREALVAEVVRLRAGIRRHRESSGQELCWHHPQLWGLLPEKSDPLPAVPDWQPFLHGCVRYRASLDAQLPHAPRVPGEDDSGRPSDPQPSAGVAMKRVLAGAAVVGSVIGVLLGSLACQKTYRLEPPAHFPAAAAKQIVGRSLHEGDNLLVDLESHKLFGEIRKGELQKLRLEVDGEKLDELPLGALARANPAPPPSGETPMSCGQKEERCLRNCRRTTMGSDYECCELRCLFNRMGCDLGWNPPGWGGGFRLL